MTALSKSQLGPRRTAPPVSRPDGFAPEYVAWEPRFAADVDGVFLCMFGIELRGSDPRQVRDRLVASFAAPGGPEILETGTVRAGYGQPGQIWFGYWRTRSAYQQWTAQSLVAEFWADDELLTGDVGVWREECWISLDHNETSYSRDADLTGLGLFSDGLAETQIHGYWGSARDRIVAAAASDLTGMAALSPETTSGLGKRVLIEAPENVCLIRTSQDLRLALPEQLAVYHADVAPTLFSGIQHLRTVGSGEGCIGMRLVDEIDAADEGLGRTCGIGFFRSLSDLERWTHSHPTHDAIMAAFIGMVRRFEGQPGLHLWHEISVFPSGALCAEYINCTEDGGLLRLAA